MVHQHWEMPFFKSLHNLLKIDLLEIFAGTALADMVDVRIIAGRSLPSSASPARRPTTMPNMISGIALSGYLCTSVTPEANVQRMLRPAYQLKRVVASARLNEGTA